MIDYETYKRKFGTKDKRSNEYLVAISPDIYNMLNQENRLGVAFQNEIALALAEDIIVAIGTCMMNSGKEVHISSPYRNENLKLWKRLGEAIKRVLIKHRKDENLLNDRYYEVSASPEDRELFVSNPVVTAKGNLTHNVSGVLIGLSKFYRAMSTDVGVAVYHAIANEKKKAVEALYDDKHRNGTSSYYNILNFVLNNWSRRMSVYESYSKSLKLINKGIKNAGRK